MQIVNIQRSLDNFYIYTLLEVKILITFNGKRLENGTLMYNILKEH